MSTPDFIDALLELAACPADHQPLERAPESLVARLNSAIADRGLRQLGGELIDTPMDDALLTQDHERAYPIREGVAVLLVDAAILLTAEDRCVL